MKLRMLDIWSPDLESSLRGWPERRPELLSRTPWFWRSLNLADLHGVDLRASTQVGDSERNRTGAAERAGVGTSV